MTTISWLNSLFQPFDYIYFLLCLYSTVTIVEGDSEKPDIYISKKLLFVKKFLLHRDVLTKSQFYDTFLEKIFQMHWHI